MTREQIIEKYKKENTPELRKQRMIDSLNNMKPFTDEYIPHPPITDKETYDEIVIPNFIRCGAIPTDKLIKGKTYFGSCRNASEATWDGEKFTYIRHKFGTSYPETINNFDNDDGYDLFVPIRQINL